MPRTAQIHYQRITLSFPKEVVSLLREEIPKNQMSAYVAALVKEDLQNREQEDSDFFEQLEELSQSFSKEGASSLEILRSIRYGK